MLARFLLSNEDEKRIYSRPCFRYVKPWYGYAKTGFTAKLPPHPAQHLISGLREGATLQ